MLALAVRLGNCGYCHLTHSPGWHRAICTPGWHRAICTPGKAGGSGNSGGAVISIIGCQQRARVNSLAWRVIRSGIPCYIASLVTGL